MVSVNLYYYKIEFNVFSLRDKLVDIKNMTGTYINEIAALNAFCVVFSILIATMAIVTVVYFIKCHRIMFFAGIALSASFALFSIITLLVMNGVSIVNLSATPYFLILLSVIEIFILVISYNRYLTSDIGIKNEAIRKAKCGVKVPNKKSSKYVR